MKQKTKDILKRVKWFNVIAILLSCYFIILLYFVMILFVLITIEIPFEPSILLQIAIPIVAFFYVFVNSIPEDFIRKDKKQ